MLLPLLFTLCLWATSDIAFAQKRKRNKPNVIKNLTFTDEQKAELDHYFIEGEKFFILKDFGKSKSSFEKVLAMDPTQAAANYKVAQILSGNGEHVEALPYAIRAKVEDRSNKYYYLLLADIYTSLAQMELAEKTYLQMLENTSGTEKYLFDLAALQLYQKKYDAAITTYNKAQAHYGLIEDIAFQKQQIFLKQNKLDEAILIGREMITTYPDEPNHVLSLAQILISNNKLEEAKVVLQEGIAAYKNNDRMYVLQAEALRKSGNVKEALVSLQQPFGSPALDATAKIRTLAGYLALLPNPELDAPMMALAEILVSTHPGSYQTLAMTGDLYFNTKNKPKARDYYLQAVAIDGSNYSLWQNIISIEMELAEYDNVILHSVQALEIFPNQAALYYFNGTAHLIKNQFSDAVKAFNVGKTYAAKDPNLKSLFHGQLGDAYNSLGNHEKSDAAYDIALRAKPDNDHVLNNYSYFLSLRKKDLPKALNMSTKLVEAFPENSTYLDTHGWVLYMMRDYPQAEDYLGRALKYDPSSTIFEHYGDVLFQLGEVENALNQWKKARDMSDDTEMLDKKIADKQLYE